ncbi:branched-chain amino acid ABC transporter permease [Dactylosporangium vinaceum]|uniref:Branched-chain amino acid ABC transporter permease n=1 Tax=Dactylosporangium vinaceum TaxID=53362 RepID=A0ABV5LZK2_9ACTN|nr:branched-chain amino acid ABC transporter permease [Dactylosporangium vinaceum]UAB94676.1 branched-chain amino acid ABC transporter permease [Dactylosporangium vinaceum]
MNWALLRRCGPLVALVVLAALPYCGLRLPGLFDSAVNAPGTLQLLALCLVFGALAMGYDLLFGRTGMLSFGHALYFAAGVYGTDVLVTKAGYGLWTAILLAVVGTATLAALLGAVALRTGGIAFAMVTLAFAQVAAITIGRNPGGATGGEEGLPMATEKVPHFLVGVANTVNLYWLALGVLVVTVLVVHSIAGSPAGRVLAAIRDDERRVGVLGLDPYRYKLFAFTVAGGLAGLAGAMYALLIGGATPHIAASDQTLTLLVMVVLGGPGTRWGPLLGGFLFTYLDFRLAALGDSFPGPLSQPLFVLGGIFILAVYFFPGGLAGLRTRLGPLARWMPARRS